MGERRGAHRAAHRLCQRRKSSVDEIAQSPPGDRRAPRARRESSPVAVAVAHGERRVGAARRRRRCRYRADGERCAARGVPPKLCHAKRRAGFAHRDVRRLRCARGRRADGPRARIATATCRSHERPEGRRARRHPSPFAGARRFARAARRALGGASRRSRPVRAQPESRTRRAAWI